MFEYELHQIRSAELIREAENHRLAQEALRGRRAAADESAAHGTEGRDHAVTAEADARGLPVAEAGRAETVERIRAAAKSLATGAPVWLAHEEWVRAELRRAEGVATPQDWSEVVTAFEPFLWTERE